VWTRVASQINSSVLVKKVVVFNGAIYGITTLVGGSGAHLLKSTGGAWTDVAWWIAGGGRNGNDLCVFNGKIYGLTTDTLAPAYGSLLEWNGSNAWVVKARTTTSAPTFTGMNCMREYNGELFAGGQPNSQLLKWDGVSGWVEVLPSAVAGKAILSMVVFENKIYCGLSNGELWRY
jgi:hypothetical protein